MISLIIGVCFIIGLGLLIISLKYWCDKDVKEYHKKLQEEGGFCQEDIGHKESKTNILMCTNKDGKEKYAVLLPEE